MAAKRKRDNMLTGGSGDVNPQFAFGTITLSAANTFTEANIPLPALSMVANAMGGRGFSAKGAVLELLWVDWEYGGEVFNLNAERYSWSISRGNQSAVLALDNPECIATGSQRMALVTSGAVLMQDTNRFDLTAGDGHGLLVSLPSNNALRIQCSSTGLGSVITMEFRVAYRVKLIDMQEFIGMLSSQT